MYPEWTRDKCYRISLLPTGPTCRPFTTPALVYEFLQHIEQDDIVRDYNCIICIGSTSQSLSGSSYSDLLNQVRKLMALWLAIFWPSDDLPPELSRTQATNQTEPLPFPF